jgi:hypothetical protein
MRDGKEVAPREIRQNGNGFCIKNAMDQTGAPLSRVLLPVLLDASLRSGRK